MVLNQNKKEDCRICNEIAGKTEGNLFCEIFQDTGWRNFIIHQSDNFCVLPSLGQIVEGYSLIVPKSHYTCIGSLPERLIEELIALKKEVVSLYSQLYSDVIFFEHGCISDVIKGGSCVTHCHLNLIPIKTQKNLVKAISGYLEMPAKELRTYHELRSQYMKKVPYLFYEDSCGKIFLFETPILPSQFFRQLLAKELGCVEKWDWRRYIGKKEVSEFFKKINVIKKKEKQYLTCLPSKYHP